MGAPRAVRERDNASAGLLPVPYLHTGCTALAACCLLPAACCTSLPALLPALPALLLRAIMRR